MQFVAISDNVNRSVGRVVGFLIVVIMIIIVYEVVSRYVFDAPTSWVHEVSQYIFGAYFMLGGAYTLLQKSHVNVDIIIRRLSLKGRSVIDIATWVFFFAFAFTMVWFGGDLAWNSFLIREKSITYLHLPLYPTKIVICIAGALLLLQGIAKLIRDIRTVRGEHPQ